MKYAEAKQGRIFVIRLEDGEIIHETIEEFAREHAITAAALIIVGGADAGSRLIAGPENGRSAPPIVPIEHVLADVHEMAGAGTIFPDESGRPVLHMHMACGRETDTVAGCIRNGVRVWQVAEVILFELADTPAARVLDPETGFALLDPQARQGGSG